MAEVSVEEILQQEFESENQQEFETEKQTDVLQANEQPVDNSIKSIIEQEFNDEDLFSDITDDELLEELGYSNKPKVISATNPKGMQSGQPKTTNMFAGAYARLKDLAGNLAQGIARVNKNDSEADKLFKVLKNPAPFFLEQINKLNPFDGNKDLDAVFKMLQGDSEALEGFKEQMDIAVDDIGYGRKVPWAEIKKDWGEGELGVKKFATFVLERFVTSIPDMASVVSGATIPPYIISLSNENLNARLKNDNKTLEDATVSDVTASVGSAMFPALTEKYAVDALLGKGGFKAKGNLAGSSANVAKQAGVQGAQEVLAEGVTYAGQTVGTERGFSEDEFKDILLESFFASAPIGGAIQTVRETGGAITSDSPYTLLPQQETPTVGNVQDTTTEVEQPLADQETQVTEQLDMQLQDVEQESINEGLDSRSVDAKVYEDDIFDDATDQLNREFQLSEDETVILNKVNYSPKMAKIQNAIKEVFGVDLVFANFSSDQSIVTNIGRNLGKFNGFRIEGRDAIVIDEKAFDFNNILGHELTHVLETRMPEEFQTLLDVAKRRIPEERQQQFRQQLGQTTDNRASEMDDTLFESELVAEMVGEQASDITFWQEVYAGMENKTVARQLYDAVNEFYQKVLQKLQGSEFITERQGIIEARKASTRAFQNFAKGRLDETQRQTQSQQAIGTDSTSGQVMGQAPPENISDIQQQPDIQQDQALIEGESSNTELDGVPTVEVPLNELVLEGTVKQFKSGANERGIVTPLVADKYERVGTPPIIVWQRIDGTKEIITGRHRFDLAQRLGEQTIPAHILREADGVTADQAYLYDIKNNILNNNGKVIDYVNFFRLQDKQGNRYDKETARLQGLLSSAYGRRAYNIATNGTDVLVASLQNNENNVKDDGVSAEKIANAVPNDEAKQLFGLRKLGQRLTADEVVNLLKILETNQQPEQTTDSLFGATDTALVKDAENIAKLVTRKQKDINLDIASVRGTLKNPERAEKLGVNMSDPVAVQNSVNELTEQKRRLENFTTDPELMAQLRQELNKQTRFSEVRPAKITFDYERQGSGRIDERDVKVAKGIYREELEQFNNEYKPRNNIDDNIIKTAIAGAKADFYEADIGEFTGEFNKAFVVASNNLNKKLKQFNVDERLSQGVEDLYQLIRADYGSRLRNYDRPNVQERVAGFNPLDEDTLLVGTSRTRFSKVRPSYQKSVKELEVIQDLVDGKDVSQARLDEFPKIQEAMSQLDSILAKAPLVKKIFDARMKRAFGKKFRLRLAPVKKFPRAFQKGMLDYRGNMNQLKDIVRATIEIQNPSNQNIEEVIRIVQATFTGAEIKRDTLRDTSVVGYRDINITGIEINGVRIELQVNTTEMLEAKKIGHKEYYEKYRGIRAEIDTIDITPENEADILAKEQEITSLMNQEREFYSTVAQSLNLALQSDSDISTPSDANVSTPNVLGASESKATGIPPLDTTGTPLESKNLVPSGKENLPDESGLMNNNPDITTPSETTPSIPRTRFSQQFEGNKFKLPKMKLRERISNKIVDSVSRVKQVQEYIAKKGGVFNKALHDVSKALQKAYNRSGTLLEDFKRKTIIPIINDINASGLDLSDVSNLLYAKHAREANEYIASINPDLPDGGSGMKNQEATDIIDGLKQKLGTTKFAELEALADRIQAITKDTQKILLEGGLVSRAMLNKWNTRYNYFVPLRGFEQADTNDITSQGSFRKTGNQGFDFTSDFSKRRKGRSSRATDIFANIVNDYTRALINAEQNKVRQTFLAWVTHPSNKDDKLWQVDAVVPQRVFVRKKQQGTLNYTDEQFDLDIDMNPTVFAEGTVQTKFVVDRGSQTIPVRYKGKIYSIKLSDPEMFDDMLLKGTSEVKPIVRKLGYPVRLLSKLWTAYSPEFLLTNAERDIQTALASMGVEVSGKATKEMAKKIPKSAWAVWKSLRGKTPSTDVAVRVDGQEFTYNEIYEMYKQDGGKVGSLDIKSPEDRASELDGLLKTAKASWANPKTYHRKMLQYLGKMEDVILDLNSSIEQMYRVSAYATMLEMGYTRDQAGTLARNITVNFARRGKWTPYIAPLFIFLNPAVQGVVRTAELTLSKKGGLLAGSLTTLGMIVASWNAGNEDEDGKEYWTLEAHRNDKLRNLLFFNESGDKYKFALPYGLGFFVNLGYVAHDVATGRMNINEGTKFMTSSFFQHFSPLGAVDNPATFLSPTPLDPFVVVSSGTRETGLPLYPPNYGISEKPDSERYWSITEDTMYERTTTFLNSFSGGTDTEEGLISISPETLKYGASYIGGGLLSFIAGVAETIDLASNVDVEAPFDKNTIPFLRRHFQKNTGKPKQIEFYKNLERADKAYQSMRRFEESRKYSLRNDVQIRNRVNDSLANVGSLTSYYIKILGDINKEREEALENVTDDRQRYEIKKRFNKEKDDLYSEFNKEFYQAEKVSELLAKDQYNLLNRLVDPK